MYCFVFCKTNRTQDICLSEEFLQLSLFSCGWNISKYVKEFLLCSSFTCRFFSPTTFAFVIVKSEKNYIIILSKIHYNPTLCSLSRSINRCSDIFNSSWNSNSNGYSGLFFGILFQNEGQSNFHSFK